MNPLNRRLVKLESREQEKDLLPTRTEVLDDTRENVEARLADIEASGERPFALIFAPHRGESVNEYRRAAGLDPLDIPGWDTPRP